MYFEGRTKSECQAIKLLLIISLYAELLFHRQCEGWSEYLKSYTFQRINLEHFFTWSPPTYKFPEDKTYHALSKRASLEHQNIALRSQLRTVIQAFNEYRSVSVHLTVIYSHVGPVSDSNQHLALSGHSLQNMVSTWLSDRPTVSKKGLHWILHFT